MYILLFFDMQLNVKTYHLLTKSYAKHKASDMLYDSIIDISDKFLEVYIGRYGRPKISPETIIFKYMADDDFISYLKKSVLYLENDLVKYIKNTDTELLNIRDELLASINQTLYLLALN